MMMDVFAHPMVGQMVKYKGKEYRVFSVSTMYVGLSIDGQFKYSYNDQGHRFPVANFAVLKSDIPEVDW